MKTIRKGFFFALPALLLPLLAKAQDYGNYPAAPPPWWQAELMNRFWPSVISVLLGLVLGAFLSEKCKPFRAFLALGVVVLLAISNMYLGCVVLFFAAFSFALKQLQQARAKDAPPVTFGSAKWATLTHLEDNRLTGNEGLRLGVFLQGGRSVPLHYTGNRHLLTVAPTRSGKGVSAIIPNLLTYGGSALVIDPKGENALITAKRRMAMGQAVHVVDPWGITGLTVARFNPLDWLKEGDTDISENAMMLADSIIPSKGGQKEPFWDEEAKALLMGLLLYVALEPEEAGNRNLGRVRDIITMDMQRMEVVMQRMSKSSNPIVSSTAYRTSGKEPKLLSGVLATLQSHTHFLDSPRMRESLGDSDFSFEDMKTKPVTVYLVLPADRLETFGRWLRLLVQQAITINARNIAAKPNKPILFLLDEMAALGRLAMVEQAYGLMAGFGMQLWGIVQDLGQLERIYGDSWETFLGNSGVVGYYGSRDAKTADYFSKLCGVTTIEKFSWSRAISKSIGSGWGAGGSSGNEGSSDSETYSADSVQRHLAFPDELMVLRDDKQLLFIESFDPIQARKVRWYQDKALQALGVNLERP